MNIEQLSLEFLTFWRIDRLEKVMMCSFSDGTKCPISQCTGQGHITGLYTHHRRWISSPTEFKKKNVFSMTHLNNNFSSHFSLSGCPQRDKMTPESKWLWLYFQHFYTLKLVFGIKFVFIVNHFPFIRSFRWISRVYYLRFLLVKSLSFGCNKSFLVVIIFFVRMVSMVLCLQLGEQYIVRSMLFISCCYCYLISLHLFVCLSVSFPLFGITKYMSECDFVALMCGDVSFYEYMDSSHCFPVHP